MPEHFLNGQPRQNNPTLPSAGGSSFREEDHPRAADGEFAAGGGGGRAAGAAPAKKPRAEKPTASSWFGDANPVTAMINDSPLRQKIDQDIATVREELRVPKSFSGGYCAEASVVLWDKLGRPKDLVPHSVFVGEDEHVVLIDKKSDLVVDPTGDQYDYPAVSWASKKRYSKPKKLTGPELESARQEARDRLASVG